MDLPKIDRFSTEAKIELFGKSLFNRVRIVGYSIELDLNLFLQTSLIRHLRGTNGEVVQHGPPVVFKCQKCTAAFDSLQALREHRLDVIDCLVSASVLIAQILFFISQAGSRWYNKHC